MSLSQTLFAISSMLAVMLAALVRLQRLKPQMTPFIWYLGAGILNELASLYTSRSIRNTSYNNNVFILLECLLLIWQFKRWSGYYGEYKWNIAMAVFCLLFFAEMYWRGFDTVSFYFNVSSCYFLSLCATYRLAVRAGSMDRQSYNDKRFLICVGMLIYFLTRILLEAFWHYGIMKSISFRNNVMLLMILINFVVNLVYLMAILWTRKKPDFITA